MDKVRIMPEAFQAMLPRRSRVPARGKTMTGIRRLPTKDQLALLLGMAGGLMSAANVEAALRAVAEGLTALQPDAILLISNNESGDSCYYLDAPRGSTCLELNHRMCSRVRKLVDDGIHELPLRAFMLDDGCHVVAPFSLDVNGGYIALSWKVARTAPVQRLALELLPHVAALAGTRLNNLLDQLHREEAQCAMLAATQSRHIEELRVSEHEKAEARELAAQDELTGLQNRRGFLAKSEQCLLLARRQGLACAVIFADVDGLKLVNDKLGHAAGDELIRDAAYIFNSAFRHADVVGRVGGDEFAAFTFDNATPRAIVDRIRAKMADFNRSRNSGLALSLSIGVIHCDVHSEESLPDYLARADEEMYRQKRRTKAPSRH